MGKYQQTGTPQGFPGRITYPNSLVYQKLPAVIPCMRPVLATFRATKKSMLHAWAVQGKDLVNLEATTKRVRLQHAMKTTLGLGCHAEKTYIKESAVRLLGKSRYERGELFQQ